MQKIGIIGAGKVGTTLGKYLFEENLKNATLCGYYSRSMSSSEFASKFTNSAQFNNLKKLIEKSTILIITTPDDEISNVWNEVSKNNIQNKIVCHLSGSLSSEIFFNASSKGASVCSMHPLMAINSKTDSYKNMNSTYFTLEGDKIATDIMSEILDEKGNRYKIIQSENKVKYHMASVFMSNLVVGLSKISFDLLEECGFSQKDSINAIKTLSTGNVNSIFEYGLEKSLTGPVERNDIETVRKHLNSIASNSDMKRYELDYVKAVYRSLSKAILEIAEKKYPNRDYSPMKKLLDQKI